MNKQEEFLKNWGFKQKKGDYEKTWWEKYYKTKIGNFILEVFFDTEYPISIVLNWEDIKKLKWSRRNLKVWDEYFTKISCL